MAHHFDSGLMVGESAWHKLGNVIGADDDRRFSVSDCIELAGLDWRVELGRCFYLLGDGDDAACDEIPGAFSTLRVNSDGSIIPLGTVGSKYSPLQNDEAFAWFQPWLDTREVAIETAGALKNGRITWVLARILRDDIDVGGGDRVAKYLTLTSSHDGSEATKVGFTPVRIVCWNTLSYAHSTGVSKMLRVRHTAGQHDSLSAIRETIDLVDREFVATGEQYKRLLTCGLSPAELRRYVKLVCDVDPEVPEKSLSGRMRKRIDKICRLAINGKGQDGSLTAWSAYNGVTEYFSHLAGSDDEKRLLSNMNGSYGQMNQRAFELAMQLSA